MIPEVAPREPEDGHTSNEAARRHGASVDEDTQDADVAYAKLVPPEPTRYRDGWLPS